MSSNMPSSQGGGSFGPIIGGGGAVAFALPSWISGGNTSGSIASVGGGGGAAGLEGFSFTPPPLVLNGQSVAGGLNFTFATPVAQVDQASQAYNFLNTFTNNAYSFVGNAINQATTQAGTLNTNVVGIESSLGQGEVSALQTLANAEATAASKLNSGGGGLFGALF
jgi:hypothetical protein